MGRRKTAYSAIVHLIALQFFSLAIFAWAGSDRTDRAQVGSMRQLASNSASRITIHGELKCTLSEANEGLACPLQIQNKANGEVLNITGTDQAMRLFQDGKTQVVATGEIEGTRFRVSRIEAE